MLQQVPLFLHAGFHSGAFELLLVFLLSGNNLQENMLIFCKKKIILYFCVLILIKYVP